LEAARAKGKELGRPRRLTEEQLTAIRQDLADEMPVAAVARKYGVPRSTLRGALNREEARSGGCG
jgi:DNA invertase Pin-like site-specific DNA recombinase